MGKIMKRNTIMILAILATLLVFAAVAKAEVINPVAKTGLFANGEKQMLIEEGKLTDGDEEGRHYIYKFANEDDSLFNQDVSRMTGTDAGSYAIEWQLISTRDGGENILDAGIVNAYIGKSTTTDKPNADTGIKDNNKLVIGVVAFMLAAVILTGALWIKEKMGE